MTTQIWINEPQLLFKKDTITQLWPTSNMSFETKINAITRLTIFLSILGFIFTMSLRFILIGIITLASIYFMWINKMGISKYDRKEGFIDASGNSVATTDASGNKLALPYSGPASVTDSTKPITTDPITLRTFLKDEFYTTNKKNPLSNVLLTDIMDDPKRKSAPPSFNMDVQDDITKTTKQTIQYLNPGIKNTNKQLFSSMTDKFYLDQSNRSFFSTANTKIPNDQGAFADFLYGDMPSCRDGDGIQCVKDNYRYILL